MRNMYYTVYVRQCNLEGYRDEEVSMVYRGSSNCIFDVIFNRKDIRELGGK